MNTKGACDAILPRTNNVEQCLDDSTQANCETSKVSQLWPTSSVLGIDDSINPKFVPNRACSSFVHGTGTR
jgi:hypothetical protein